MFDWTRAEFDKGVIIRAKKKLSFNRNFNVIKLGKVAIIKKGKSITTTQRKEGNIKVVAGGRDYAYLHNEANRTADVITISASGAYAGFVNYWDEPIFASDCNTVQGEDKMQTLFLYNYLVSIQDYIYTLQRGAAQPHVYSDDIANIPIPDVNRDIQAKIVSECDAIDADCNNCRATVEACRNKISYIFENLEKVCNGGISNVSLSDLVNIKNGLNYVLDNDGEQYTIVGVKDFQDYFTPVVSELDTVRIHDELSEDYKLQKDDILCVRSNGSKKLVGRFLYIGDIPEDTTFSGFTLRLRLKNDEIYAKFLCYYLRTKKVREIMTGNSKGSNIQSVNQKTLYSLAVPIPSMDEQKRILQEVSDYEYQIQESQKIIQGCAERKKAVLKHYLN